MGIVQWLISVLAPVVAIRFVWMIFKYLTSKENMCYMLEKADNGLRNTANTFSDWMKKKSKERKKRQNQKRREQRPIVTIM